MLTFYGGANEIGGNKILLEEKDAKVYFDFGESFTFGEGYFYDYLQPRSANGLEVYFEFGMLPEIPRLYSKEMLELTELKYQKPDVDAVFISHSHSDHVGHIGFLDESIPVHMGHGTRRIMETYHALYPSLYPLPANSLNLFKSGDSIRVKHLEVRPIHVEHSIPGAYGFIVERDGGPLVYTGDFRMHGPRRDMSEELMNKAAKARPEVLLCEGTRMHPDGGDTDAGLSGDVCEPSALCGTKHGTKKAVEHNYTEAEVERRVAELTEETRGLVLAYFSMSNVDRFMSFYNAARKAGRKLVIGTELAYVVANLREKVKALPDVASDPHVRVYFRLAKSCTFCEKDYRKWEREFMKNMITYREIRERPGSYLMHLNFYKLMELVYLRPEKARFIYSMSEHFYEGEDNKEQREVWENWMRHFKIDFKTSHCSGHAGKKDLEEFIRKVKPDILVPIHTQHSECFMDLHKDVRIPEKGKTMKI